MIKTSKYSYNMLELGDIWYPAYDRENMQTVENQLDALISFVGPGVIDGWDITTINIPNENDENNTLYRAEQLALMTAYESDPYSKLGKQFSGLGLVSTIDACRVASVVNITLSGLQIIDGVDVQIGDRILVKNQTTQSQNGVYIVASGSWTRASDFDANVDLQPNMIIKVNFGFENTNTLWSLSPPNTANNSPYTYVIGTTKLYFHDAWEQVIRVTPGNGFVGKWAAKTLSTMYFRFTQSNVYYVWAEASNCLVTEGIALIVAPQEPDIDYDLLHTATFLGEVWVAQKNNANNNGDYSIYIDRIEYTERRQVLKNLASALDKALREAFYRHVHLGGNNHPSKINLSTNLILNAIGPIGSTIFLIQKDNGQNFTWNQADYGIPVVKIDDVILPEDAYVINASQGKLYLQNSISPNAIIKIILPLAKQISLTIQSDSDIVDSFIYLTDGTIRYDSNGNPNGNQIYTWDAGLHHEPLVFLKGELINSDVIPYTLNASRGGISFLPALSGLTYEDSDLEILLTHIGDEITGKLSGTRLKDISASSFTSGVLDNKRMHGLSHVGQNRYMEQANIKPSLRLFDSGNHMVYYPEVPDSELQYNTNIYTIYNSKNFKDLNILLGTKHGLMQTSDFINADLQTNWLIDNGQPVQILDNLLIPKNINHFNTTYIRSWDDNAQPRTGKIFYSTDGGDSWKTLKLPTIATNTSSITASPTVFQVSTERVEVNSGLLTNYEWYTVYNLGTNHGLYQATVKEGMTEDEWSWEYQSYLSNNTTVHSLLEMVTLHESWDGDGNLTETFDRSIYTGADTGFFVNGFLISNEVVKNIYWLQNGTNPRKNNIIWHTDTAVYLTHTAKLIEENDSRYYVHPLNYFEQSGIVQVTNARVATNVNITNFSASCPSVVDGITLAVNDRVLVRNQVNPIQNGVYSVVSVGTGSNGQWTRVADMAAASTVTDKFSIRVTNGQIYGGSIWHIDDTAIVDTDNIVWNNLVLRVINDVSRIFSNLHQHINDTSVYFALTNNNIYRIDDIYDADNDVWSNTSASFAFWDELYQKAPQCIYSDSGGDYGSLKVGGNQGLWKSTNAFWDNALTISPWVRTSYQFISLNEPTVFDNLNYNTSYLSELYSNILPQATLQHNVDYQAFIWKDPQAVWANYLFEKDYTTFWANPWNTNADIVVYINNKPSQIPYDVNPDIGKIQFISSVGRNNVNNIKITILRPGAFIADVGVTPHGEMPNSFVTQSVESTVLSADFTAQDIIIHVADDSALPVSANYIELRNATSRERLNITIDPLTRVITLAQPRSGKITFPANITKVFLVNVQSVLGIEDKITKYQSNQTYHLNSLGGINTLQLSLATKDTYTSPVLFNNYGSESKIGYASYRGPQNAIFFDFATDAYDETNSSSAFYVGNEPQGGVDTAVEPTVVYSLFGNAVNGNGMRFGTDQGVWRYSTSVPHWIKESSLNNATKSYFIQNVDSIMTIGTDDGAYQKNNSNIWSLNNTYPQSIFAQVDNKPWKETEDVTYTYDAWGKDDGLAFVLRSNDNQPFVSDHFDALDGRRVYGLYHDQFIRINTDSQGNTTQVKVNALYLATEDGLFAVTDGTRSGNYSSVLTGRQMFGENRPMKQTVLPNEATQLVPVKFYNITKSIRPNSIPLILLSNNGIYIVRNWRWCDPDPLGAVPLLDFYTESHSLNNISCYCHLNTSEGTSPIVYKMFVGTESGVYRSYNDGYSWEKCEKITNSDIAVYSLIVSGTGILAATEDGLYYSNDDGDSWFRPNNDGNGVAEYDSVISTAVSFNSGYLAQTFKLDAVSNDINKIALYLSPVDLLNQSEYEASLNNTLEIAIYSTTAGLPNAPLIPVGSPDIISAADVLYRGWYYANISVTGLTPGNTYALVVRENIAPGGVSIFKWHTSKTSNSYNDGQAISGGVVPTWNALTNQDFYFKVYQPSPPIATEIIEPVGFYDNTMNLGWWTGEGRGYVVNDDGKLTSNVSPIVSMVVDDSRSIKWSDPSLNNPREVAISNIINSIFNVNDITLSGDIFPELNGQIFYPSLVDFWVFGSNILERTNGFTNDLTTLQVLTSALYERGLKSEPYDAANIAFGGLTPQSIIDAFINTDEEYNIEQSKLIVQYMNDLTILRHDDIVAYWDNLPTGTKSEWGTTGGYLDSNIPYYSDVRDFVLQRYIMLFVPIAVLIADGDGAGNASDVALTLLSAWDSNGVKPAILGLGANHRQQDLRLIADLARGRHISVVDGSSITGDWDLWLDSILPTGDDTLYQAYWSKVYDFDDATYISVINANTTIGTNALCVIEYRYTFDRINWSQWIVHPGTGDIALNMKVLGIEYRIRIEEGLDSGVKTTAIVDSLYHKIVNPGYKYLITKPYLTNGMLFEYLLSADIGDNWPITADLQWGIMRSASNDFNDIEYIRNNRKGALSNRQSSIQFTDELNQEKLDTVTSDFQYYYVKDNNGQTVTWSVNDVITVYTLILGEYREVIPDGSDGDSGLIYFSNVQPNDLIIKVTITTPQELFSSNGEPTSTKDGRTYTLANGSWPKDAIAIVLVNGNIIRGGYYLSPDDGTVTFVKERERTDLVTVYIQFQNQFKIGLEIKNYSTISDVTPSNFGLYYTTKSNGRLLFLYQNTSSPSILNNNVEILPNGYNEPTASQRLIVDYTFVSEDNNIETDTQITWWRKRPADPATYSLPEDPEYPGDNFQQMTYENIETIGMTSRHFPEYNNRTTEYKSDVGANDWFKPNDIIRIKVTPSDGISYGVTIESEAVTLSGDNIPYVTGVTISATGKVEDPASSGNYYVPAGTELRAYYVYTDPDTGTVTINGTNHTSLVEWYLKDSQEVFATTPSIAANIIQVGQAFNVKITPRDGTLPNAHVGIPVTSETIVVR